MVLLPKPFIKDLRPRLWSLNRYPYLAFIFHSPLICSPSTGLWHHPKDTAKSWKLFEHLICLIAEKLQLHFTTENPNILVIWEAPAKPYLYCYFTPHATLEAATVAINNSIDGFNVKVETDSLKEGGRLIGSETPCMCSVRRSGPRNRKKTGNWTELDRLGPDRRLRLRAFRMTQPI
jgi:hypothetical protein